MSKLILLVSILVYCFTIVQSNQNNKTTPSKYVPGGFQQILNPLYKIYNPFFSKLITAETELTESLEDWSKSNGSDYVDLLNEIKSSIAPLKSPYTELLSTVKQSFTFGEPLHFFLVELYSVSKQYADLFFLPIEQVTEHLSNGLSSPSADLVDEMLSSVQWFMNVVMQLNSALIKSESYKSHAAPFNDLLAEVVNYLDTKMVEKYKIFFNHQSKIKINYASSSQRARKQQTVVRQMLTATLKQTRDLQKQLPKNVDTSLVETFNRLAKSADGLLRKLNK